MVQTPAPRLAGVLRAAVALLLASMLAGCSGSGGQAAPPASAQLVVEGYVVDERLVPLPGVLVEALGSNASATTDEAGHFELRASAAQDLVLVVAPAGYVAQSRAVSAFSGGHQWVNVTLAAVPFAAPFHTTEAYAASVQCGVTAVVGEDPSRPHEHQGVRCSDYLDSPNRFWNYTVPTNTTGLVLEAVWEPSTPAATAIVLRVTVQGTGEVLSYKEGSSPMRLQLSAVALAQNVAAGFDVVSVEVRPGAGTGEHDHGAVGAFVQQQVDLYMTAFFNGPVDPTFTIAG